MADELVPAPIRDGGTGSVQVGGVRAPDYRQLQAPEQVDTNLPDSGAAHRAEALENLFKEFEGVSSNVYNKVQTKTGALAGAASGATGHPQYKQGLAQFTAYSQAFNNAATGAYAVEAEAQADDSAARLRVEANNNPDTFAATYSAVRDAVLKTAPAQSVPMLTELYNKRLAAGLAAIRGDQLTEQRNLQRQTYDVGIQRQVSRVAQLQGSANPADQDAARDEQVKLSLLIEGGTNSRLYSKAEAEALHVSTARQVTEQVFDTQVDRELAKPDGDPEDLIARFRAAHETNSSNPNEPQILSEPEFQRLMQNATTKIREQRLLDQMNKANGKTAEQLKYEAGDKLYTSKLFENNLTDRDLDNAVRNGDLKPERATALRQLKEAGPVMKSDPKALLSAMQDPNLPDMTIDQIAGLPGISNPDKIKLGQEAERQRTNWQGTQLVKDARAKIDVALKIRPGTPTAALSDEQSNARAQANLELTQRLTNMDPALRVHSASSVADEVIKHTQQREAAADVTALSSAKQNFITRHGPGSVEQMPDEAYKARLKQYDDQISARSAAAKGD